VVGEGATHASQPFYGIERVVGIELVLFMGGGYSTSGAHHLVGVSHRRASVIVVVAALREITLGSGVS
jgi:hypothetical protein